MLRCTVQCASVDDHEDDIDDDDLEVFDDCDEQVPVVRPIAQSYMIRPPNDARPFPADTAASRPQPLTASDGKRETEDEDHGLCGSESCTIEYRLKASSKNNGKGYNLFMPGCCLWECDSLLLCIEFKDKILISAVSVIWLLH